MRRSDATLTESGCLSAHRNSDSGRATQTHARTHERSDGIHDKLSAETWVHRFSERPVPRSDRCADCAAVAVDGWANTQITHVRNRVTERNVTVVDGKTGGTELSLPEPYERSKCLRQFKTSQPQYSRLAERRFVFRCIHILCGTAEQRWKQRLLCCISNVRLDEPPIP